MMPFREAFIYRVRPQTFEAANGAGPEVRRTPFLS